MMASTARARLVLWRFVQVVGVLLLVLAGLEGLQRVVLAVRGRPYRPTETAREIRHLADPAGRYLPVPGAEEGQGRGARRRELPLLHPYTGSEAHHDTGGVLAAFREGFAPEDYVVVVVGGSVAASWANTQKESFPRRLAADPRLEGRRVRVLNYAHASYKQPQQLMRIAYLFSLGFRPDAVIALDGFNEVALALQNLHASTHPVYPPSPTWALILSTIRVDDERSLARAVRLFTLREETHRIAGITLRLGLHHSSLLGSLSLARLRRIARTRAMVYAARSMAEPEGRAGGSLRPLERQMHGPDFDPDPEAVLRAGARNWVESSRSLHAMCAERGILYLHVLQPTLHDAGAKPFAPEELALGPIPPGWEEGARDGYPLLRGLAPELVAAGVAFLDASRLFAERRDPLYTDHCHLNLEAERLLTEAIARAFLEHLPPR